MPVRIALIASATLVTSLVSGGAHATLQGRDLDGNATTAEAYYDTVLDITWLKDANYGAGSSYDDDWYSTTTDGRMHWDNARNWAANLSFNDAVNSITYANWRLPTVSPVNGTSFVNTSSVDGSTDVGYNISSPNSELGYMFYVNLGNPSAITPTGSYGGCGINPVCLQSVGPFTNLQPGIYWSGTAKDNNFYTYKAYAFEFNNGDQFPFSTAYDYYAWAVSPGDVGVAAVPEPETYAMLLAGLALVGAAVRRRG